MRREQTDSWEDPWNPLPLGAALPGGSAARRMGLLVVDRGAEDEDDDGSEERKPMPLTADGPTSRAGLPPPKGPGWTDRVRAPERLDEGLDEFGNRVTGKWMPKGIDQNLWEQIRGATIEGYLGTQSKVLKGFTRACVYTRDYRDLDDLRRILTVLRKLGVRGWIDYKRDCDTARGLYGRGALYWQAPPGTVAVEARVPQRSPGTRDSEREPRPSAIVDGERCPPSGYPVGGADALGFADAHTAPGHPHCPEPGGRSSGTDGPH